MKSTCWAGFTGDKCTSLPARTTRARMSLRARRSSASRSSKAGCDIDLGVSFLHSVHDVGERELLAIEAVERDLEPLLCKILCGAGRRAATGRVDLFDRFAKS